MDDQTRDNKASGRLESTKSRLGPMSRSLDRTGQMVPSYRYTPYLLPCRSPNRLLTADISFQSPAWECDAHEALPLFVLLHTLADNLIGKQIGISLPQAEPARHWVPRQSPGTRKWRWLRSVPFGYVVWIALTWHMGCQRNDSASSNLSSTRSPLETLATTSASASAPAFATSTRSIPLQLDIAGFGNDSGSCRVAVYLSAVHFNDPEYAIAKESIEIHDSKASWQVELRVPLQSDQAIDALIRIAVSAYHDENDNSKLDKNSFGIPIERYGFSKNPKRGFGPPQFNETAIEYKAIVVSSDAKTMIDIPILIK